MKHAYLIIAHGNWEQLKYLLKQIDSSENDIYIHIDRKVKNVPFQEIKDTLKKSNIEIYQQYKVYWGSIELVKVELFLLKMAIKNRYDYYHLLSGMDMMVKTKEYINEFFAKNNGKEFVHFDTDDRLKQDKEIMRRVKCYHFFVNYRKRFNKFKFLNSYFTFLERISLTIQTIIKIDRTKKYKNIKIKYGSQWFDITHNFACYILKKENDIYKIFYKSKCADELVIQTLIYNSEYRDKLYNCKMNNDIMSNLRLIDIKNRGKNGSPYTWRTKDFQELTDTECLFARKFNVNLDKKIVDEIYKITV